MKKLSVPLFLLINFALPIVGQNFINPSLELWATPGTCETNTAPDGWTNYSNVGLGPDEGNLLLCPSTIPTIAADGNTFARCLAGNPNTGEGMFQIVSGLLPGTDYEISFSYCGTNLFGGSGDCVWHLFIDDADVNQSPVFSSGNPLWSTHTYVFTATMGSHKFGLRAYTPTFNGGGSAAIDHFLLIPVKPTGIFAAEPKANAALYPNPFNEVLYFSDVAGIRDIVVTDITGRHIWLETNLENGQIQTAGMLPAIYYCTIQYADGSNWKGTLIKL